MYKGSKELNTKRGATIEIRSSGPFCAYAMEGKKRTIILGPINTNARILKYKLPSDIEKVFVKTEKSTEWTMAWSYYDRSEILDETPVEMPVGYEEPETLADQMRRFIKDEVSKQAVADNMGSFEEEDDFELDEMEPLTNYELTDMEEVEDPGQFEKLTDEEKFHPLEKQADDPPKENDKTPDSGDIKEDSKDTLEKKAVDNEAA